MAMKRRTFLKSMSAAAIAAPTIVPSSVFGQNAPSNRINMATIGTGGQGTFLMGRFLPFEDIQMVAVCDLDSNRRLQAKQTVEEKYAAATASGTYKGCDAYNDFREVTGRDDIDAVIIATVDHWHTLVSLSALRNGKDIYCEKPLTLTIEEGRVLSDEVKKHGTVFQVGSMQRSDAKFRQACELVRNGYIGKVDTAYVGLPDANKYTIGLQPEMPVPPELDYNFWLGQAPWAPYTERRVHFDYRWILDYSDGMIADWGAHHLDIAQWGLGRDLTGPSFIEGQGKFLRDGLWDHAVEFHVVYTYDDGVKIDLTTSLVNKQGVRFVGSEGEVFVSRREITATPESLLSKVIGPDETRLYRSNNHYRNFLECVRSREETITPVEVGHRSATVCHMGNIAMLQGRKLEWDPVAERFVNDPAADRMIRRTMRSPWNYATI